jgi:hypothetical protein
MSNEDPESSRRALQPYERISEILFGLIMVLTFTGSLSVADAGRDDVRAMLIGALGCNLAWGLIDGLLYLMGCMSEQGRSLRAWRALRKATAPEQAHAVIADTLPPMVAAALGPAEYEAARQRLLQMPEPSARPYLGRAEWRGALAVFLWVNFSTFPVAIPFFFMDKVPRAMRASNAIAIALLFVAGWAFGRVAEHRPWLTAITMVFVGVTLVSLTIALGG